MVTHKVDFEQLKWEEPMAGVSCKTFKQGNRQLRLVVYTQEMTMHWCEKGHSGYILEGTFEIEYENEIVVYERGDGVMIPEGKEHRHRAKVLSETVKAIFVEKC